MAAIGAETHGTSASIASSSSPSSLPSAPRVASAPFVKKTFIEKALANSKKSADNAQKGGTAARPALRRDELQELLEMYEAADGHKRADQNALGELLGKFNANRARDNAAALGAHEAERARLEERIATLRDRRRQANALTDGSRPRPRSLRAKRARAAAAADADDTGDEDDDGDDGNDEDEGSEADDDGGGGTVRALAAARAALKQLGGKPRRLPALKIGTLKNKWNALRTLGKRTAAPTPLDEIDIDTVTTACTEELEQRLAEQEQRSSNDSSVAVGVDDADDDAAADGFGGVWLPSVCIGVRALVACATSMLRSAFVAPVVRRVWVRREQLLEVRRVGVARRRICDQLAVDADTTRLDHDLVDAARVDLNTLHDIPIRHTPEALALASLRCELQDMMAADILQNKDIVADVCMLVTRVLVQRGRLTLATDSDESGVVSEDGNCTSAGGDGEEDIAADSVARHRARLDSLLDLDSETSDASMSPMARSATGGALQYTTDDSDEHECELGPALCALLHSVAGSVGSDAASLAHLSMTPMAIVSRIAVESALAAVQRTAVQVRTGLICTADEWLREAERKQLGDSALMDETKFSHLSKQSIYYICGVAVRKGLTTLVRAPLRKGESTHARSAALAHIAAHMDASADERESYCFGKKVRALNRVRFLLVCAAV